MKKQKIAMLWALLAAGLYALNVPFSKLLLVGISPSMLAGLLYLGAGIGVGFLMLGKKMLKIKTVEPRLTKADLPYTVAMVVLDIAAPIFLMYGITYTTAANVSLLNNFEIVATSLIALFIFRERISGRLWIAILLVTVSGAILGFEGGESFAFNQGSLFVIAACVCWGIENNCTRSISDKSAEEIVLIKGCFSGLGSLIVAFLSGEHLPSWSLVPWALLLGFVAYGLSIKFYVSAQNTLGAAKTSAFYSIAPFLGVGFGFAVFRETPSLQFVIALAIMILATVLMVLDTLSEPTATKKEE